jgi:hypothetical protein
MSLFTRFFRRKSLPDTTAPIPGEIPDRSTERGYRTTPENAIKYLYRAMWVDSDLRARILDIREMDQKDGRVKKVHSRTARAAVKGGLRLQTTTNNQQIINAWREFERRVGLATMQKLTSDARGMLMEGNCALQVVLNGDLRVAQLIRMPTETLLPKVDASGRFSDPTAAWEQHDLSTGTLLARFALWELITARLDPDNYDDQGSMGRPYLDSCRTVWKKLAMTEEDLVIRRRTRAPLRLAHVLEGATEEQLDNYRHSVESEADKITTDFYLNRKGGVQPIQGDASLDQIADVSYLLDTFFAGAPAPKGLFGYTDNLNRDILADIKIDYFEEIDALQDTLSDAYEQAFRFDLLLQGINPEDFEFCVQFAERRTDTPNQRADLALKYQALGVPKEMVWDSAGLDASDVKDQIEAERNQTDPYPESTAAGGTTTNPAPPRRAPVVSIVPNNRGKNESSTSISNG